MRMNKAGLRRPARSPTTNHQARITSVTVIVLAVHDVRAPRIEPNIHYFLELLRLRVDDDDSVLCRIREIELLVFRIRRRGLELDVRADLHASRRTQTV